MNLLAELEKARKERDNDPIRVKGNTEQKQMAQMNPEELQKVPVGSK